MTPEPDLHAQFLDAVARADTRAAQDLLAAAPEIVRASLCAAAGAGDLDAALALLNAGASPNESVQVGPDATHDRVPALYFACVSNNAGVARVLLEHGAFVNDGESLYHAAEFDHRECLELLRAHGADLSAAHAHWGNTPLYFLSGYTERSDRYASVLRGMEWLLRHGADPDRPSTVRSADGASTATESPLHRVAAAHQTDRMARLLLAHGADVHLPTGSGRTAFAIATRSGNVAVAACLAAHGARTNLLDHIDRFLGACHAGDGAGARALLDARHGLPESLGAEANQALVWACERDNLPAVALMLDLGWRHDVEGPWGGTPLHWAAWFGSVAAVRCLVDHGAGVNVRDATYGSSPIAWAAHGSRFGRPGNDPAYLAIVRMLLDVGAERSASYNKWNEAPEGLASDAVAALLRSAGFTA